MPVLKRVATSVQTQLQLHETKGLRRVATSVQSRLNDVGSGFHERYEPIATATSRALLKPGAWLMAAGLICALVPPLIILLAPLMFLLLPVLLPAGLTLACLGATRCALALSLGPRRTAAPVPAGELKGGTLAHLNSITTQRGEALVRQVAAVLRANAQGLTRDISSGVEEQLAALQGELQTWVGANPNLRPYSEGKHHHGSSICLPVQPRDPTPSPRRASAS